MAHRNSRTEDIDFLLELLDETFEDKVEKSDVNKFIQDYDLKPGNTFYPNSVIYYVYIKDGKYEKYKRRYFFRLFSTLFKQKTLKNERGYLLASNFAPTEEDYDQGRILTRKDTYGKKNKKK